MPEQQDQINSVATDLRTNPKLGSRERERREAILRDISQRVLHDGSHRAQTHPDRARQFMPFAALKGYHELAHECERKPEPRRALTEEREVKLSDIISRLSKGSLVSVMHYESDRYITTKGTVTRIDETFRTLYVVKKKVAFRDIFSIEVLD